jgi:inorganic triphosphatase YgiF
VVEVELKFSIDPRDHGALERAAALAGAAATRERLETTYFDTPDGELAARGLALRLRKAGGRWIEGLKAGESGTGGLHARHEWEHERAGPGIDLALYARTPLGDLEDAATLHERLAPAFRVSMMRTAWQVAAADGSRLEVALDAGEVEARSRSEPISEVEIECLEGDPQAAFDLAARLLDEVRLRPSAISKAQRGWRLFRAERPVPVKARAVVVAGDASPEAAARRAIAAGLWQLQANEEGLLETTDPEFVHQARIALRRLRAALRIFRDAIGPERARSSRDALGGIARALGAARDWDVFATQTLPPVLTVYGDHLLARELRRRVERRRAAERAVARGALRSAAYARAILDVTRWLSQAESGQPGPGRHLRKFASRVLRRRHDRLLRDAADPGSLSPEERHQLRIDAKRLRYGTDALASLYDAKRVTAYLEALSRLQDALGDANDAANALRLLEELAPPAAFAEYSRGVFTSRARSDPALVRGLIGRLRAARPWRG